MRTLSCITQALALGAALLLAHPASAAQAMLKGTVIAQGEKVTLGDLFDEAAFAGDAELARVPVLAAPRPGESLSLDAIALQRFAAGHHLDWPNTQGLTAIKIERASTVIGGEVIERALIEALEARGLAGKFQIRYSGAAPTFYVAAGAAPSVSVRSLNVEVSTGQFTAIMRVETEAGQSAIVAGRAYKIAEIPVLAHDVKPGDTIGARDVSVIELPAEKLGQTVITAADDLIGTAARRMIRAGEPLRLGDVEAPILVKKGTLVTMSMQAPGISLTAEGRALEDGAKGEAIRIMNTNSKRTVVATVQGEGLVMVGAAAPKPPALAANDTTPVN